MEWHHLLLRWNQSLSAIYVTPWYDQYSKLVAKDLQLQQRALLPAPKYFFQQSTLTIPNPGYVWYRLLYPNSWYCWYCWSFVLYRNSSPSGDQLGATVNFPLKSPLLWHVPAQKGNPKNHVLGLRGSFTGKHQPHGIFKASSKGQPKVSARHRGPKTKPRSWLQGMRWSSIVLLVYVYIYTHTDTHTHIHVHVYIYMYIYIYICTKYKIQIHIHIDIHIDIFTSCHVISCDVMWCDVTFMSM